MSDLINDKCSDSEEAMIDIVYVSSLMLNFPEMVDMVLHTQPDDFLYQPRDSEVWDEMSKAYELIDLDSKNGKDIGVIIRLLRIY